MQTAIKEGAVKEGKSCFYSKSKGKENRTESGLQGENWKICTKPNRKNGTPK
jgi:hypothetical protein